MEPISKKVKESRLLTNSIYNIRVRGCSFKCCTIDFYYKILYCMLSNNESFLWFCGKTTEFMKWEYLVIITRGSEWFFQKQPPELFYKKGLLKKFRKFIGKHLCQSLFF